MAGGSELSLHVLAATDFSIESERAFYHALAISAAHRARLTLLHIGPESRKEVPWERYPGVRDTLIAWGHLDADSQKTDVGTKLGISVKKMAIRDESPRLGMIDYLRTHPTDLMIMATEGRAGFSRLARTSVAESVSQETHSTALLLPKGCRGFVDADSGKLLIKTVVCAIDHDPDPRPALQKLAQLLPTLSDTPVRVVLLHIGDADAAPELLLPEHAQIEWLHEARNGDDVVGLIATAVADLAADLVVVTTRGPRGLLGRIKGSTAERIMRATRRPLLAIPAPPAEA